MNGTFSWTPSIKATDESGRPIRRRQLPYVPGFSAAVTGRLSWRTWSLLYKWCYYSQRYTMSSNDLYLTRLSAPTLNMNNVTLEKQLFPTGDLSLRASTCSMKNTFPYCRPMPGIQFRDIHRHNTQVRKKQK